MRRRESALAELFQRPRLMDVPFKLRLFSIVRPRYGDGFTESEVALLRRAAAGESLPDFPALTAALALAMLHLNHQLREQQGARTDD